MRAPGAPGLRPTWTSSAKDLVTTALGPARLWATLGYGIVNEVYYPSTGQPQIRDLGFLVASPSGWTEVKRANRYRLTTPAPTVPLATVVHEGDDYQLTLEVVPDPEREVLLVRYALRGDRTRLYPLLAPHLGANGHDNSAWLVGDALCARGGDESLALVGSPALRRGSVGYVGTSDGWQDFARNGALTWSYDEAPHGNVAMIAETEGEGVLALGLAETPEGALTRARSSLAAGFAHARAAFVEAWERWGEAVRAPADLDTELRDETLRSAMVLKVHEDKAYPGAVVASLSVPWGNARDDLGGYHLVWPRDAVEAGLGLLAAGQLDDARRMLAYLVATQDADGHWSQNAFPDGRPFWTGIQLDEVGFPLVLAAALSAEGALDGVQGVSDMARRAAGYLVRHGPVTPQDRWEENAGVNPFTLAVEVVALIAAAELLPDPEAAYLRSVADGWNERIEEWTYVTDGPLAADAGVDGYYVRIAPPPGGGGLRGAIPVRNRQGERVEAAALVSLDYLALTRLGLRAPDDPRIAATTAVVDRVLRVELPTGTAYHRYNDDGYGETADGAPFQGSGIGRAWPLLAGERAHLALQRGDDPLPALRAMRAMAGRGGMIPEQVWDREALPQRGLEPGRPSGSAMPLVWAHAEFLKLALARERGRPLELLPAVERRYGAARPRASTWIWTPSTPVDTLPAGRDLRVECAAPFTLHLGWDDWQAVEDVPSRPLPFGRHGVVVAADRMSGRRRLRFTLHHADGSWSPDAEVTLHGGDGGPTGR